MKRTITIITFIVGLIATNAFILSASILGQDQTYINYGGLNWSADSKHLAYTKTKVTRSYATKNDTVETDVYVVLANGGEMTRFGSDGVDEGTPAFSRDGKSLLYGVRDRQKNIFDVYSAYLDGTGVKRIATNLSNAASPQVSPNGEWLIFTANISDESGTHYSQIFVMKSGGGDARKLTKADDVQFHDPMWSPDGKSLVYYVTHHDQKNQVWIMDKDGQNKRALTDLSVDSFSPSWSADGKRILFTTASDRKGMLYSIKPDGTDMRPLRVEAVEGRWSPNGKKLAYTAGRVSNVSIFVANADGSGAVKIVP